MINVMNIYPGDTLFELQLRLLGAQLMKSSKNLTYAQDYINIAALRMIQEEQLRVIMFNVEQEVNAYVKEKVRPEESQYQSTSVPLNINTTDNKPFMGRLADEIQRIVHPQVPSYLIRSFSMKTSEIYPILCIANRQSRIK